MEIKTLLLGPLGTNCYILEDTQNHVCAVIDPADNAHRILSETVNRGIKIKKILLTHTHFDHMAALGELYEKTDAEVLVGRWDKAGLTIPSLNLSTSFSGEPLIFGGAVTELNDNDTIVIGDIALKVLETPGHTPGSVCFVSEKDEVIFSGDTVFAGSIGRTDFPGGDFSRIIESLNRVLSLGGEYLLYPGHGAATRVADEKVCNPFFTRKW